MERMPNPRSHELVDHAQIAGRLEELEAELARTNEDIAGAQAEIDGRRAKLAAAESSFVTASDSVARRTLQEAMEEITSGINDIENELYEYTQRLEEIHTDIRLEKAKQIERLSETPESPAH